MTPAPPDPIAEIRARIAEREKQIQNLEPQIARNEQFGNQLRGQLFTAQAQHTELSALLKTLEPAPPEKATPDAPQIPTP